MTPKEKAKELLLKFMAIQFGDFPTTDAKRCALIAVDEMIELCESYVTPYYQQVKQEIEKL